MRKKKRLAGGIDQGALARQEKGQAQAALQQVSLERDKSQRFEVFRLPAPFLFTFLLRNARPSR